MKASTSRLVWQWTRRQLQSGFTLTELLVGLILSAIFLVATAGIVTGVMRADQREAAVTDVQGQLQNSLDYITRDLKDAVFVYTGQQLQDRLVDVYGIPQNSTDQPVLAFWKIRPSTECRLGGAAFCDGSNALAASMGIGDVLSRGNILTLVVYYYQRNPATGTWDRDEFGPARITRMEVDPFVGSLNEAPRGLQNGVYVAPNTDDYTIWPPAAPAVSHNGTFNQRTALVAHVADINSAAHALPGVIDCTAAAGPGYLPSPRDTAAPAIRNAFYAFYACVRPVAVATAAGGQDVVLFLQGDAAAKAAGAYEPTGINVSSLQTQVFTRGQFGRPRLN